MFRRSARRDRTSKRSVSSALSPLTRQARCAPDRALDYKRGLARSLTIESLEDRRLLAYTALIDASGQVTFTGNAAADTIVFSLDGAGNLQHNRSTAGDAGFASNIDLDSILPGVQSLAVSDISKVIVTDTGANDTLNVDLGNGVVNARVQPQNMIGATDADLVTSDNLPAIQFADVATFRLTGASDQTQATFVTRSLDGATNYEFNSAGDSTVIIEGDDSRNDAFEIRRVTAGPQSYDVIDSTSNRTISLFNFFAENDAIQFRTLGGDDALNVNVDAIAGSDVIRVPVHFDGGVGFDSLTIRGESTSPLFGVNYLPGLQPDEGRLEYLDGVLTRQMFISFDNLEPVLELTVANLLTVVGTGADNTITYNAHPSNPTQGYVAIDGFETIAFENKSSLELVGDGGDDLIVINNDQLPAGLTSITASGDLPSNLGGGNDVIRILSIPDASTTTFVRVIALGNGGNDTIDASLVTVNTPMSLEGAAGDDVITGGAGTDEIFGGTGNDTFIASAGNDVYDGGTGIDVLLIRGTNADDVIDVFQGAPVGAAPFIVPVSIVNGPLASPPAANTTNILPNIASGLPSVERIRIEALAGDDVLRVGHHDAYTDPALDGTSVHTLPIDVYGDAPNASDRLIVRDHLVGDLVIQRIGADGRSGSVAVGGTTPNAPISYYGMEFVDISPLDPLSNATGGDLDNNGILDGAEVANGRLVVFKHDPFESNNSRGTATFIGAGVALNVDPTIDPGGITTPFPVAGDNDFYRFVAQETGTLDFKVLFDTIATVPSGRPGLPGTGNLTITVFDSDGAPAAIGTALPFLDPTGAIIGKRIAIPVVRNQTYFLRVTGATADAINVYSLSAINIVGPVPEGVDLQAASDSGRSNADNITKIATSTFDIILDDARLREFANQVLVPDNVEDDAASLLNAGGTRVDYGVEMFNNGVSIGFAFYTGTGSTWRFTAGAGDLTEGSTNFISAAVWIRDASLPIGTAPISRNGLSRALLVTFDTTTPAVSFGLPDATSEIDGLAADSDSGVAIAPQTAADRITNDTTPRLWGRAEANSVVRVFLDLNGDGVIQLGGPTPDVFLGQTVAVPLDGNNAFAGGYWELVTAVDLNQVSPPTLDGARRLLVTAEDVAGNPMPMAGEDGDEIAEGVDSLQIFLDTQGPRITGVGVNNLAPEQFNLFDPKPLVNGPTPAVTSLRIFVRDLPDRVNQPGVINDFVYEALVEQIAESPGNFLLVGDHVGTIAIQAVTVTNFVSTGPGIAIVELTFFAPLPDDRYTLTMRDSLVDPAGNRLDGELHTVEPQGTPQFPTGNSVPGGDFVARFTIDSRPEIAAFIPQQITVDINGNFVWDPSNGLIGNDATNVDLTFTMGVASGAAGVSAPGGFGVHDLVFAGKFYNPIPGAAAPLLLFDQLAVYGNAQDLGAFRWLVDRNSDGIINVSQGDVLSIQPVGGLPGNFNVQSALPVAGNFDGNRANGDEIGLYNAGWWAVDSNRNFVIDAGDAFINNGLMGHPIVGDFDGDGLDDFAVFNANVFSFDLANSGFGGVNATLVWGFPGVLDRPVAADMDLDGIDDLGLWVPRNSAQDPTATAEWYFLISGDLAPTDGVNDRVTGSISTLSHPFEPTPFGRDLYAEFGNERALPLVGNFDPPVAQQARPATTTVTAANATTPPAPNAAVRIVASVSSVSTTSATQQPQAPAPLVTATATTLTQTTPAPTHNPISALPLATTSVVATAAAPTTAPATTVATVDQVFATTYSRARSRRAMTSAASLRPSVDKTPKTSAAVKSVSLATTPQTTAPAQVQEVVTIKSQSATTAKSPSGTGTGPTTQPMTETAVSRRRTIHYRR